MALLSPFVLEQQGQLDARGLARFCEQRMRVHAARLPPGRPPLPHSVRPHSPCPASPRPTPPPWPADRPTEPCARLPRGAPFCVQIEVTNYIFTEPPALANQVFTLTPTDNPATFNGGVPVYSTITNLIVPPWDGV